MPTPHDASYKVAQRRGPTTRVHKAMPPGRPTRRQRTTGRHRWRAIFTGTSTTEMVTKKVRGKGPGGWVTVAFARHKIAETKARVIEGHYTRTPPWARRAARRRANAIARASRKANR